VSPDSRWVAYRSNESGKAEIYVRPFPPGAGRTGKWLVSSNGGGFARWRGDGKELFYATQDRKFMAVDVTVGPVFQSAAPRVLFTVPAMNPYQQFDVTRDGKRFLVIAPLTDSTPVPATVTLNWDNGLKK